MDFSNRNTEDNFWNQETIGVKENELSNYERYENLITIAIHILTDISRSKGNQAMKFGQLIEYKKSCTKCGGEPIPRPFYKQSKFTYLWMDILQFYVVCFIVCQVEDYRN